MPTFIAGKYQRKSAQQRSRDTISIFTAPAATSFIKTNKQSIQTQLNSFVKTTNLRNNRLQSKLVWRGIHPRIHTNVERRLAHVQKGTGFMIISKRDFTPDWRKDTFVHCTSTRCFPLGFVIILSLRNVCHGNCLFLANKLILGLQSIPGHAVTMRQPCWWNSSNMAAMKPGYSRHVRHCYFTIRSGNGHFVLIGQ